MPITNSPGPHVPSAIGHDGDYLTVAANHPAWAAVALPPGGLQSKGALDCSLSPNYPAALAGHVYHADPAGRVGGASGPLVDLDDVIMCVADSAAGTHAAVGANWVIGQANIVRPVSGPVSSLDGHLALFDGTGGRTIKDAGVENVVVDGLVTQNGTDATASDGWNIQANGFESDSGAGSDTGFIHSVDGVAKWAHQTYRDEDGQFYYLYTPESKQNPLTVSDGGRIGVNKPTNIMNYHSMWIDAGAGALNDMDVGGVYTRPFDTLYEVAIAAAGDPDTFKFRTSLNGGDTWSAYSTPAACPTTATALDAFGVTIKFDAATGHNTSDAWRFTAFSQLPSAALTINPTMFVEVNTTTDYTVASPAWSDITGDMASLTDTARTLLPIGAGGTTKGAVYMGCHRRFNAAFFNVVTPAVGATLVFEYWDGLAWAGITGAQGLQDQSAGLTTIGSARWDRTLMADWSEKLLDGKTQADAENYYLYWIRVRSTTVMSQAPTADLVTPQGNIRLAVYAGNLTGKPSFSVDGDGAVIVRRKPVSATGTYALGVLNETDENYRATIKVATADTSFNVYKGTADDDHRTYYGYGHVDFWNTGIPAVFRHKFAQGFAFYNNMTDQLLLVDGTGAITAGTAGYEALVKNDNDLTNKKYVDQLIGGIVLQADWNAATNTPDITGATTAGYAWNVTVEGTTDLGGIAVWAVGDLAVKTASGWTKIKPVPAVWGVITGTLSAQGDLQAALNAKVSSATLAAWAGTTNITTLGTVGTGVWHGTPVDKNYLDTAVTAQGNTFNGSSQLVQTTAAGKYPALDGSLIASVTAAANLFGGDGTSKLGSLPYQSGVDATTLLDPNTTTTKKFLRMTGDGSSGAAPAWDTIAAGDVPTLNQDTTGSAVYVKAAATTGKISLTGPTTGQTRAKTVRDAADTILELGGSYTPTAAWNWATATVTWPTFNQSTTGTAAKATNLVGGNSTTLLGAIGYQSNTDATTLLAPNTTATKRYLTQTGTGTNGAAPAWDAVTDVAWPIATKTAAYPATAADSIIVCDTTSTAFTVTLPTAVNAAGKVYVVKRISAGTNRLTIATTSAQTIDGAATAILDVQYASLTLVSDGSNWLII